MLKEGLFRDFKPQAMFGLHVFSSVQAGKIAVRDVPLMPASDRFSIKVTGCQTHGSAPWNGIGPIVASADLIGAAQTVVSRRANIPRQPAVLRFGAIKGGIRYNIPDDVEMAGTIRTFDEGMRQQIFADLKAVAEHAAAHGARAEAHVPDQDGNPAAVDAPALTATMLTSLRAVVGADNVYEPRLQMGAGLLVLRAAGAVAVLLRRRHRSRHRSGDRAEQPLAAVPARRVGAERRPACAVCRCRWIIGT